MSKKLLINQNGEILATQANGVTKLYSIKENSSKIRVIGEHEVNESEDGEGDLWIQNTQLEDCHVYLFEYHQHNSDSKFCMPFVYNSYEEYNGYQFEMYDDDGTSYIQIINDTNNQINISTDRGWVQGDRIKIIDLGGISGEAAKEISLIVGSGNGSIQMEDYDASALGSYSFAIGRETQANGHFSYAEGYRTVSGVLGDEDEGIEDKQYTHAEGEESQALGWGSHAEGYATKATGSYSHAQGNIAQADGDNSHAEGVKTYSGGLGSHAEGFGHELLRINNINSDNSYTVDYTNPPSIGTRVGLVDSNGKQFGSISRVRAFRQMTSSGGYIWTDQPLGDPGSTSKLKVYSGSDGEYSHSEGVSTLALGKGAHAEGNFSVASGSYSHAEGYKTHAVGAQSHAEGVGNQTYVTMLTQSNNSGQLSGNCSSYLGYMLRHDGQYAKITEVNYDSANSKTTVTFDRNLSQIPENTTVNLFTGAHGVSSHVEGINCCAGGIYSHAEGYHTKALEISSHAEGYSTIAKSSYSHAEGRNTQANGAASHAQGISSIASGYASFAAGEGVIAGYQSQTALGRWNVNKENTLLEVGKGSNGTSGRSNAFEVLNDGRAKSYGTPSEDNDLITKSYADTNYVKSTGKKRYLHEIYCSFTNATGSPTGSYNGGFRAIIVSNKNTEYTTDNIKEFMDDLILSPSIHFNGSKMYVYSDINGYGDSGSYRFFFLEPKTSGTSPSFTHGWINLLNISGSNTTHYFTNLTDKVSELNFLS